MFVGGYLPGYRFGGPLQSIANLVDRLGTEFNFSIVTADRDLGATEAYPSLPTNTWVPVGRATVMYLSPNGRGLVAIARLLNQTPHDALYLNSFFDLHFSIVPLMARWIRLVSRKPKIILAPRGEFGTGALTLKATKKRAFLAMSRLAGLHRGIYWQASTPHEAADIRRTMNPRAIFSATDVPRRPAPRQAHSDRSEASPLRIVFLSRISPMKNLLFALDILAQVPDRVTFTIHGPTEDADYWERCVAAIAALPANIEVAMRGPVQPTEIVPTLVPHDMLFLPTLGENYGHVIGEALEAGLRILISDRTPWRGLEAAGVGYDLSLDDPGAFIRAIGLEAARTDRAATAARSYEYLSQAFRVEDVVEANRRLLSAAIAASTPDP